MEISEIRVHLAIKRVDGYPTSWRVGEVQSFHGVGKIVRRSEGFDLNFEVYVSDGGFYAVDSDVSCGKIWLGCNIFVSVKIGKGFWDAAVREW